MSPARMYSFERSTMDRNAAGHVVPHAQRPAGRTAARQDGGRRSRLSIRASWRTAASYWRAGATAFFRQNIRNQNRRGWT